MMMKAPVTISIALLFIRYNELKNIKKQRKMSGKFSEDELKNEEVRQ